MFSSRNHGFDAVVTCSCSKGGYNKAPKSWKSKDMNMSNMPIARRLELFSNKDEVDDADSRSSQ